MANAITATRSRFLLAGLFFVSGIPALLYQLVWQRALFRVFGVHSESAATVVAAFMLGLGAGSLWGGRLSKARTLSPWIWFALLEGGTALYGVFSLDLFWTVEGVAADLGTLSRAGLVLALLLPPTLMMGATLPVLVSELVRIEPNVGRSVGTLYFANTLGSAFACFLAIGFVMRELGMAGSVHVAVALNALVGASALVWGTLATKAAGHAVPARATPTAPATHRIPFAAGLALSATSGFVSLSYELLWLRAIGYFTAGRSPAFAMTLGLVLLGLALGARWVGKTCDGPIDAAGLSRILGRCVLGAAVLGAIGLPLAAHADVAGGVAILGVLGIFAIAVAGLWGAVLPLAAHVSIEAGPDTGRRLSHLYAANIVGAVAGSLLTGFVALHWFGTAGTVLALTALSLTVALAAKAASTRAVLLTAALAACSFGFGFDDFYERLQYKGAPYREREGLPFAELEETRSGVVAVATDGEVFGGGIYDGHVSLDPVDDRNFIVRPLSLSLWHASPRDVLEIGVSAGAWTELLANHPQIEHITAVEINTGYLPIIRRHPEVAPILSDPRVTLVIDDGRRWLRRNPDARFDAIVMNTTFHYRANATNLLSQEFLRIVRAHLKPHGVAFFNTTASQRVQRTACSVFADGYRFYNFMLVSPDPIEPNVERWRATLERYQIRGRPLFDLRTAEARAALERMLRAAAPVPENELLEHCSAILERTRGAALITDDNMGTEWYSQVADQ